jgi:hypothetical protein
MVAFKNLGDTTGKKANLQYSFVEAPRRTTLQRTNFK